MATSEKLRTAASDSKGGDDDRVQTTWGNEMGVVQKARLKKCFELFDVNKDGKISKREIIEFYAVAGQPLTNAKRSAASFLRVLDKDENGSVDWQEFKDGVGPFVAEQDPTRLTESLKGIYGLFAAAGPMKLEGDSVGALSTAARHLLRSVFDDIDTDRSGKVRREI